MREQQVLGKIMSEASKNSAYKDAGVDIDAAADLVEKIKTHVGKTKRSGVMSSIGGFGALFDLKAAGYNDPILVSSTDGVGTKIKIAIESDRHETIGIDLVAMCVNDLIVQGAEPLFFLDYFATGKLANDVAEKVIAGVAEGCAQSGCALIGGETAEMPGLYAPGDYDLAGFSVGAVDRERIINGETMQAGDVVLGLGSSGVHSNGYSLVRKIVKDSGLTYESAAPFKDVYGSASLADALLIPTKLYVKPLLTALRVNDSNARPAIRGLAHITGGGLTENIPRVVPEALRVGLDARAWPFLPVFKWLKSAGKIGNEDLARTLNCGIGMVIICSAQEADTIESVLGKAGESVYRIGGVAARKPGEAQVSIANIDEAWA